MALENYSCQKEYNSLGNNPIHENKRSTTNVISAYVSGIFIATWLASGIYVLSTAAQYSYVPDHGNQVEYLKNILQFTYDIITSHAGAYVGCIALTVSLMILYMIMLRGYLAKFLIYLVIFGTISIICLNIVMIVLTFISLNAFNRMQGIILITIWLVFCIYKAAALYSVQKVGVRFVTEIVNESCRAIFNQYPTILFSFAFHSLLLLMIIFTFAVFDSMRILTHLNALPLLLSINILGGLFVYGYILYFGEMVIADCIANWYWTIDKKTVSKTQALTSTARILRYHSGSVGFGSTYILPFIQAIYVACTWKPNPEKPSENKFIRFICKLELILSSSAYFLIQTSIYGTNHIQSAKKTFDLVLNNSLRFLAVIDMSCNLIITGFFIVLFLMALVVIGTITGIDEMGPEINIANRFVLLSLLTVLIPFFNVMYTSIKTLLFCTLKDLEENNGSQEKPYYMNYALQRIVTV